MSVEFTLEGRTFVALNGGAEGSFTPAISFVVRCPTPSEVDELWRELSEDGEQLMALDSYPFSDRYGWTNDKFGVSWQLIHDDDTEERSIVPSLLFVGDRCGQAEAAIQFYTTIFKDSRSETIARYGSDEDPNEEGTVKFADFTLCGMEFSAMDSALEHQFDFNESISFVVDCADQTAVDCYWDELTTNGGEAGQWGWLTDRYGISWRIIPAILHDILQEGSDEDVDRVTKAMLKMEKIDISTLEDAYSGDVDSN